MPDYAPSNLIDLAVQYTKEAYIEFKNANLGITYPLTPNAWHGTQYLRLREDINRGCRKACTHVPDKSKRPPAFAILMGCLYDMFHGRNPELCKQVYNAELRHIGIIPP